MIATLAMAGCGETPPEHYITRATVSAADVAALREDERDILLLLLGHACDNVDLGWRIAVRARTVEAGISDAMFEGSTPTGKDTWRWWQSIEGRKAIACPVAPAMGRTLMQADGMHVAIDPDFHLDCAIELLDDASVPRSDEELRERRIACLYSFSPIVFDERRERALVVTGWRCGGLSGGSDLVLLGKRNGDWEVTAGRRLERS